MSDEKLERLVAYLQENVGRYGRQSVWDALLQQGHDPTLVNEAFAKHDRRSRLGVSPEPSPAPAVPDGAPAEGDQAIAAVRQEMKQPDPLTSKLLQLGCGVLLGLLIVIALIILAVGWFCVDAF